MSICKPLRVANIFRLFPKLSETCSTFPLIELEEHGYDLWVFANKDPRQVMPLEDLSTEHILHERLENAKLINRVTYFRDEVDLLQKIQQGSYASTDVLLIHWSDFIHYILDWPLLPMPVVICCHEPDFTNEFLPAFIHNRDTVLERVAAITFETKYQYEQLIAAGFPMERMQYWHGGVDIQAVDVALEDARQYERNDADRHTHIVSIGRFIEKKGFLQAIEAMQILLDRGHAITYNIIGDGLLMPEMVSRVQALKLQNIVHFPGKRPHPEIYRWLAQSDIFLAPSDMAHSGDREGLMNSVLEAMSCGLTVISTNHGGTPDVIRNEVNGILLKDNNPETIASTIERMILNPHDQYTIGQAAHQYIRQNWSLEQMTKQLQELLESVVSRTSSEAHS